MSRTSVVLAANLLLAACGSSSEPSPEWSTMHEHVLDACQQGHEAYIGIRDDELSRQDVQDALETGIAAANEASAVIDASETLSASNTRDVQTAAIAGKLGAMAEWLHQGDGVRYAESYAELEDLCKQAFAAEWRD